MAPFESGRRLCLLFEAGGARYAVEATSVLEVAPPGPDGKTIRGSLELKDLSKLLGGGAEERPGMGVVLDVSPTLAARVKSVDEVADVSRDPFFLLPPALGDLLNLLVRGALLHQGKLYLELITEALPQAPVMKFHAPPRPVYVAEQAPERALVFESQGRLFGVPLNQVQQIVPATDAFCPLPSPGGPVAGLFPHDQVLWPAHSAPALLGGTAQRESLFVLTEAAGQNVGLTANRVLGVHDRFSEGPARGELVATGLPAPALFLDLQRMFS